MNRPSTIMEAHGAVGGIRGMAWGSLGLQSCESGRRSSRVMGSVIGKQTST